jgi:hypothetical protein
MLNPFLLFAQITDRAFRKQGKPNVKASATTKMPRQIYLIPPPNPCTGGTKGEKGGRGGTVSQPLSSDASNATMRINFCIRD